MRGRPLNAGPSAQCWAVQGRPLNAGPSAECRAARSAQGRPLNAGPVPSAQCRARYTLHAGPGALCKAICWMRGRMLSAPSARCRVVSSMWDRVGPPAQCRAARSMQARPLHEGPPRPLSAGPWCMFNAGPHAFSMGSLDTCSMQVWMLHAGPDATARRQRRRIQPRFRKLQETNDDQTINLLQEYTRQLKPRSTGCRLRSACCRQGRQGESGTGSCARRHKLWCVPCRDRSSLRRHSSSGRRNAWLSPRRQSSRLSRIETSVSKPWHRERDASKNCTCSRRRIIQHALLFVLHECCWLAGVSQVCDCWIFCLRPFGSGWVGWSLNASRSALLLAELRPAVRSHVGVWGRCVSSRRTNFEMSPRLFTSTAAL